MMRTEIERRTLGVNVVAGGKTEISVWAPLRKTMAVVANGKKIPLKKNKQGYWNGTTTDLAPGDLYRILINGRKEVPDPASLSQPEGVHGPSQVLDLRAFSWSDGDWKNPSLEEYIIYELHTGTWTPEGSFGALEKKLDYLTTLGVNAVELMPVAQFPGSRNWGYDGVFPFAVQNSYGGAPGLQHLVNTCHERGLAVVLDVVYNHLGPEGNYLGEFGPYFTDRYRTPWGNAVNYDDAYCDGVRKLVIENALMWLRDFHIDALRLDAVHAIRDFSPVHILHDIKMHVDELMHRTGRTHYLIAELDLNDPRFINPPASGGYGMDAQWVDEFHHALRVTSGQEKTGYYSDFSGIDHLAKSYRDAYVFDGQYSEYRKKIFGMKTHNPGRQFVVFSQNHDHIGNRRLGERTSRLVSFEMQKLLAAAVFVSPYIPLLFMGEEYGETNPFLYFVSHTDKKLAEAVRRGRREEFAAFHAEDEVPDPAAPETFLRSKLQWELPEREPHGTMFRYYRSLIRLRKTHAILRGLHRDKLLAEADAENNVLYLLRWDEKETVLCLLNFAGEAHPVIPPDTDTRWTKIFDSAAPEWLGPAAAAQRVASDETVVLQPESILIFTSPRRHV